MTQAEQETPAEETPVPVEADPVCISHSKLSQQNPNDVNLKVEESIATEEEPAATDPKPSVCFQIFISSSIQKRKELIWKPLQATEEISAAVDETPVVEATDTETTEPEAVKIEAAEQEMTEPETIAAEANPDSEISEEKAIVPEAAEPEAIEAEAAAAEEDSSPATEVPVTKAEDDPVPVTEETNEQ